jgi:hypothetical protein
VKKHTPPSTKKKNIRTTLAKNVTYRSGRKFPYPVRPFGRRWGAGHRFFDCRLSQLPCSEFLSFFCGSALVGRTSLLNVCCRCETNHPRGARVLTLNPVTDNNLVAEALRKHGSSLPVSGPRTRLGESVKHKSVFHHTSVLVCGVGVGYMKTTLFPPQLTWVRTEW